MEARARDGCWLHLRSVNPPSRRRSPCSNSPNGFADAGCRPGVVNIITGFGEISRCRAGRTPDVDKIAFTGSAAVGKIIVKQAADTVKSVTLELEESLPNISFADAHLEAASTARCWRLHQ